MTRGRKLPRLDRVQVFDIGSKGLSVGKAADGRMVFISDAVPGDVVDVQVLKKRKQFYQGKAVFIHQYSERRVEPKCIHFGTCGGCKWQSMNYPDQLHFKNNEVKNHLQRIGGLTVDRFLPIVPCEKSYLYRNKMEFSFSSSRWLTPEEIASGQEISSRNGLGFHIPGAWDKVLDIDQCHLQEDPSNAIRNAIKVFANSNELSFFDPRQQSGLLRTLMIRNSSIGELMVLIQFYEEDLVKNQLLLDYLRASFPEITALLYVFNNKANDTIYDQEVRCHSGRDHIFEEMEGLRFKIDAKSFYQTNSDQAYELYKVVREFAGLKGTELVYDLYTGIGTIAQFIAKNAKKVVGIESVPEAIIAAKSNAVLNGISNAEFYTGDIKTLFNDKFLKDHGMPEVIITDPPRDGMHPDVVAQLLKVMPQKIIYVSCNSATQARDLALMKEAYTVSKSQAVDMFPQTHHCENVVLLEKRF